MVRKRSKAGPVIIACLLALLAVAVGLNHNLVRMIFYSNYDPELKLDVDGDWAGGECYRNVQYADVSESDYLNLYVPHADAPVPLIVLVHGGGFVTNDLESRQAQLFYQYFRDHGFACATVNYRLAQEAKFPAAVQDVKAAVRFLRANADKYGYNADRIAIWGESAGGYLCVMAGVTNDEEFNDLPFIGEDQLAEPVSSQIAVVLDYYGAVKLEPQSGRLAEFRRIGVPGFVVKLSMGWLTDAMKDHPEAKFMEDFWIGQDIASMTEEDRQVFSPFHYVEENLGPDSDLCVAVWHGDADITVPYTHSVQFSELLKQKIGEDRVNFRLFHNAKHAGEKMYTDAALGDLEAWLREKL